MTIRSRLVLTLTAVACLLALPAIYGLTRLATVRDIAYELHGRHASAWVALGRLEMTLREVDRRQRSHLAAPDTASRQAMWRTLGRTSVPLGRLRDAGYAAETAATAAALRELEEATAELDRQVEDGRIQDATDFFFAGVGPAAEAVRASLDGIAAEIDRRSLGAASRARRISASASNWLLGGLLAALLLALLLGFRLTRALVRPIRRLQDAMATVASGELETPGDLAHDRRDELGELNRSFRSMTQQLGELTRQRAEFVSIVTHELKTPINVIAGYTGMIREGLYDEIDPEHRTALDAISEQAQALLEQVRHLLDLSRLEAGAFRLVEEDVYLVDVCTGIRRAFEGQARKWMIDFAVELEPSAPERIVGDMDRLRNEVLGNLLANAFKFTEPGGRVHVRLHGDGNDVVIQVSDTGVGIPPHELPHIFERYYQGREGARSAGAGLGLAIAREVVEAHGGSIEARSRPGRGTTFLIRLPVTEALEPGEGPTDAPRDGRPGGDGDGDGRPSGGDDDPGDPSPADDERRAGAAAGGEPERGG